MGILSDITDYAKRTWKNGKTGKTAVSAAPMNHIEEGIAQNREYIKALNEDKVSSESNKDISIQSSEFIIIRALKRIIMDASGIFEIISKINPINIFAKKIYIEIDESESFEITKDESGHILIKGKDTITTESDFVKLHAMKSLDIVSDDAMEIYAPSFLNIHATTAEINAEGIVKVGSDNETNEIELNANDKVLININGMYKPILEATRDGVMIRFKEDEESIDSYIKFAKDGTIVHHAPSHIFCDEDGNNIGYLSTDGMHLEYLEVTGNVSGAGMDECVKRIAVPTQYLQHLDLDTIYDTGLYGINSGENCPSGSKYGVLLVMSYRKQSGNTYQDFCVQIFIPNGDDPTDANTFFYRTSTAYAWNEWQEVGKNVDTWIDMLPLCQIHVSTTTDGVYKSYLRYNPATKQLIGCIETEDAVGNQAQIITLPEGYFGAYDGICGITNFHDLSNDGFQVDVRIKGREIISSHTRDLQTNKRITYMINTILA